MNSVKLSTGGSIYVSGIAHQGLTYRDSEGATDTGAVTMWETEKAPHLIRTDRLDVLSRRT